MAKFVTKNALFGYFWARLLKSHVVFEINTLKSVKLLNFVKKKKKSKRLNMGRKVPYLVIVEGRILESVCPIGNQHPQI